MRISAPVGDAARSAWMRHAQRQAEPGRHPAVAVAAGLAHHGDRDLHAWTRNQPIFHRFLDAQIGPGRVSYRGDADRERTGQILGGLVELVRKRVLHPAFDGHVRNRHVHMAVDQARQQSHAGAVDDLLRTVKASADFDDPVTLDDQVGGHRIGATAVEDLPAAEQNPCHFLLRAGVPAGHSFTARAALNQSELAGSGSRMDLVPGGSRTIGTPAGRS